MSELKRIIIHWTAGAYNVTTEELGHYHYIVDKDGKTHKGLLKPEDNINTADGTYAAHTGGGNTGSIGVSMDAMRGFSNKSNIGDCPITLKQFEATMKLVAELCRKYHIPITADTVLTHYEFGKSHTNTTSYGKIDIIYLPPYPLVAPNEVGNFIREKVRWYLNSYR